MASRWRRSLPSAPMGPGEVVDVVSAVKLATKGAPGILAIDEADAINKRFPGLESIDDRRARRSLPRAAAHPRRYGDNPRHHLPLRRPKHDARRRGWSDCAIHFQDQSPADC